MEKTSTDISKLLESQHAKLLSLMGQTAPLPDLKEPSLGPASHAGGKEGVAQICLSELGDDDGEEKMQQACREWADSVEALHVKAVAWQKALIEVAETMAY